MITRLWEALDVPRVVIQSYQHRVKKHPASIAHVWLVGVTDPTSSLPAGHIFVTGAVGTAVVDSPELFITRAPAINTSDGRLLPVLSQRPAAMSQRKWDWLLQLPFGAVVFSTAGEEGDVPLASTIADGDLDGDLYLVCWEPTILGHIKPVDSDCQQPSSPGRDDDEEPVNHSGTSTIFLAEDSEMLCNDDTWLEQVQAHMTDPSSCFGESKHVGKLYRRMVEVQEKQGYNHPDARALGDAYKKSLERSKHGKAIQLPVHLHY